MSDKLVKFEINPATKAVKCLRCGKDLTSAIKLLDSPICFGIHIYSHMLNDLKDEANKENLANLFQYLMKSLE